MCLHLGVAGYDAPIFPLHSSRQSSWHQSRVCMNECSPVCMKCFCHSKRTPSTPDVWLQNRGRMLMCVFGRHAYMVTRESPVVSYMACTVLGWLFQCASNLTFCFLFLQNLFTEDVSFLLIHTLCFSYTVILCRAEVGWVCVFRWWVAEDMGVTCITASFMILPLDCTKICLLFLIKGVLQHVVIAQSKAEEAKISWILVYNSHDSKLYFILFQTPHDPIMCFSSTRAAALCISTCSEA